MAVAFVSVENLYTNSRLKTFRQCHRLHFYRYVLAIKTPSSEAAEFGTIGHKAIEAWLLCWQRGDLDGRIDAMLGAVAESDLSKFEKARLVAILTAYHLRWKDKNWRIIAVEVEFRYELVDADGVKHTIGGKIDAIIQDLDNGLTYVVEHKTTGQDASAGSAYWERLSIDSQVSIYVDGATMLGYEIAGVIYDVLQRPKHEQKLATPEAERQYTLGKGCKECGGSAGGKKGIVRGRGTALEVDNGAGENVCTACVGTGWKLDEHGEPEAPRLYAKMRDRDETVEEFSERLVEEIAARPDDFLIRGVVVRLEDELPRMRLDLLDDINDEQSCASRDAWARNPDACTKFNSMCFFFEACAGRASIDDQLLFPRGVAHSELAGAA